MAVIELVEYQTLAQEALGEAEAARGTRFARRRKPTGATAEAAAELASESAVAAGVVAEAAAAGEEDADDVGLDLMGEGDEDSAAAAGAEPAEVAAAGTDTPVEEAPVADAEEVVEIAGEVEVPEAEATVEVTGEVEAPEADADAEGDATKE
jgi:large subunit ribosomal protein L17